MITYSHSIVEDKNVPLFISRGCFFPKIFVCSLPSVFYCEISHEIVVKGVVIFINHMSGKESCRGRILGFKKTADRKLPP